MLAKDCHFVCPLLLLVACWGHVTSGECPAGLPWAVFERSGSCYQFVNEERTWVAARAYCRAGGGKMVTIDSRDVQEWLSERIKQLGWTNNGVWIGLNDRHTEGSYGWDSYNGTETMSTFSFWNIGEPSSGAGLFDQDCVYMRRQYGWRWVDVECSLNFFRTYNFICQYPSLSPRAAPTTYATTFPATRVYADLKDDASTETTLQPHSPPPFEQSTSGQHASTTGRAEDVSLDFARFTGPAAPSSGHGHAAAPQGALKTFSDREDEEKRGANHGAYVSLVAGVGVGLLAVMLLIAGVLVMVWQIRWRKKSARIMGRNASAVIGMDNPVYLQDPAGGDFYGSGGITAVSVSGVGAQGRGVTLGA